MTTKAVLELKLARTKSELAIAKQDTLEATSIGDLSMELLDRLDVLKSTRQDDINEAESELEKVERAYEEADNADDLIRDLNCNV